MQLHNWTRCLLEYILWRTTYLIAWEIFFSRVLCRWSVSVKRWNCFDWFFFFKERQRETSSRAKPLWVWAFVRKSLPLMFRNLKQNQTECYSQMAFCCNHLGGRNGTGETGTWTDPCRAGAVGSRQGNGEDSGSSSTISAIGRARGLRIQKP